MKSKTGNLDVFCWCLDDAYMCGVYTCIGTRVHVYWYTCTRVLVYWCLDDNTHTHTRMHTHTHIQDPKQQMA